MHSSASFTPDAESDYHVDNQEPRVNGETGSPRSLTYDTAGLFQGNVHNDSIFKFKIDELLAQVRPIYGKSTSTLEQAIRKLKSTIQHIPNREAVSASEIDQIQLLGQKVRIPFPEPGPKDASYRFSFSKPTSVTVVGSYARKTAIQVERKLIVDLAVTMPRDIFREKDYLNYKYFHKRAYYLACIAAGVGADPTCHFLLKYSYQNDSPLQPAIIVSPGSDGGLDDSWGASCQIRIILATDASVFPMAKTFPDKNCIRSSAGQAISCEPTAFYNATLRSECACHAYLKFLNCASAKSAAFSDACILGSVWLRQRGLGTGLASGGFGPFEWACITALLMQVREGNRPPIISNRYSSYQIFKATLQYLSTTDLFQTPFLADSSHFNFGKSGVPTLFDSARGLNVLFKVRPWSYYALKHEADRTLRLLDDRLVDQFDACFITKNVNPMTRYDYIVTVPIKAMGEHSPSKLDAVDQVTELCQQLHSLMQRALGDRASLIDVRRPHTKTWLVGELAAHFPGTGEVVIGLLVNPENVDRTVDKGPSAEEKEAAAEFREFWGEKAELRRFKDGSILECLIWSSLDAKQSVLSQILTYITKRHFGDDIASGLKIISEKLNISSHDRESTELLISYRSLLAAFNTLQKQILSLEGLPLQIREISGADPSLRYTSFKPAVLDIAQSQKHPCNICVQFEGSKRWPDDFAAVQRTKIAFLLKMSQLLESSSSDLEARLGLENTTHRYANVAFLDINLPGGASFRLRIHHERERSLIERELKSTAKSTSDREVAASALAAYKRNFVQAPLHTQAIRTLSTRFPPLSSTIRFLQRWRDSHLLSRHFSDELIDLLALRTFLHPGPYAVPGNAMTGFLRTVLFLSKWDWHTQPFIIDTSGEMNVRDIEAIATRFEAWRKIDPAMNKIAMFAASDIDRDGITWTDSSPSKMVAARFTSLAKAAASLVNDEGLDMQVEALFVPDLRDYDFLLYLDEKACSSGQKQEGKLSTFKNVQNGDQANKGVKSFNSVQSFLDELMDLYGNNIVFFYNADGGDIIGGLWNPHTGPRSWKVNVGFSTILEKGRGDGDVTTKINKSGVLNDIARLGGDMIKRIEPGR
ncbi:MAG: hypothetical protein Q9163_005946 [Psora crenata]